MNNPFEYNDGKDITGDAFRISPSQLSRFFDDTSSWYREMLLGESGFQGSTASELGTVVHAAAEMYHNTGQVDTQAIEAYITNLTTPDLDKNEIRFQYRFMVEALINCYLSTNKGTDTELFIWQELIPGVGVGGSIDKYNEHKATITDYKTMGSLDKARVPSVFPRAYWFQQLTYAWVLRKQGKPVDYLELVYVSRNNTGRTNDKGKALKDYPSEVNIVRLQVTQNDLDIIESCLMLVAESVKTWNEHPELRHLLAQDMRLKTKPKPKLFKE